MSSLRIWSLLWSSATVRQMTPPPSFSRSSRTIFRSRVRFSRDSIYGRIAVTGSGEQRRFRLGEPAFDAEGGLLYVPEQFADGERPVVHVFAVR